MTQPRYNWNEAPEWACYMATDENGDVWAFRFHPYTTKFNNEWFAEGEARDCMLMKVRAECPDWRESLEARPKTELTEPSDSEMLDWLDANWHPFLLMRQLHSTRTTLRAAISAAMKGGK